MRARLVRFRAAPLALILLWGPAPRALAQARTIQPGDEVRIYVRGVISTFDGVLSSSDTEALHLTLVDGSELSIPRDQIERSEVRGGQRNTVRGAAVGLGVGLVVGVSANIAVNDSCVRDASGFCTTIGGAFDHWLLVVPPLLGAGVGALIGSTIMTGRWFPGFLPAPTARGGPTLDVGWSLPVALGGVSR